MAPTTALFGGSFNPPGLHHLEILGALCERFEQVVVAPSGPRADKPAANDVSPLHRAFLVDIAFGQLPRVVIDLSDLEENRFTPADAWVERLGGIERTSLVVAADFVRHGQSGRAIVQRQWRDGQRLWREAHFTVLANPRDEIDPLDMPPHSELCRVTSETFSTHIRSKVFNHESIEGLVTPTIDAYIKRHGLYRGVPPGRETHLRLDALRALPVVDERSPSAAKVAREEFAPVIADDPNLIVVVGGDGTMLHAIRDHWRLRVPFYGLNTGHVGFLMNERDDRPIARRPLVVHQLPLLLVETEGLDGRTQRSYAFNDAWIERATGQTAWLRIDVDGQTRLREVVADGALVATAAGSTSYARAMGAPPVTCNTPVLILVGSNVLRPDNWRPVVLPLSATIEMTSLDPDKRPLHAYIDGQSMGIVRTMRVRASRIAGVELAFAPEQDPALKLARIQFPGGTS